MSIFGSKEDDPLLQDDPFAPSSSDDGDADEAPASDEPASSEVPPDDARAESDPTPTASEGAARRRSARSTADEFRRQSVFGTPGDGRENTSPSDPTDDRVVVRPVEKAADGQLTTLNAAFDDGWRLRRVELRDVPPDHTSQSTSKTLSLAFVLRRPES